MSEPTDVFELAAGNLYSRGRSSRTAVHEAEEALGARLPDDYVALVERIDGGEGWVGDEYVAFWPVTDLARHNHQLETERFVPGIILIGSDGGGEGLGLDQRSGQSTVVYVPLVGLPLDRVAPTGLGLRSWFNHRIDHSESPNKILDPAMIGQNVYEKQPVILGGDPVDPTNKAIIPLEKLLELASWWNRQLASSAT